MQELLKARIDYYLWIALIIALPTISLIYAYFRFKRSKVRKFVELCLILVFLSMAIYNCACAAIFALDSSDPHMNKAVGEVKLMGGVNMAPYIVIDSVRFEMPRKWEFGIDVGKNIEITYLTRSHFIVDAEMVGE